MSVSRPLFPYIQPKAKGVKHFTNFYNRYPRQFWLLIFARFIDRTGGAMLMTFFALYITRHFDVGMTQAGIVLLIFSITGLISATIGGALTDRFGRKWVVVFGLASSATSTLILAFIDDLMMFYLVAAFVGLFSTLGRPATQAMVADLLPDEQRADGFALLRVAMNLAVAIGPVLGALLASVSFVYLFIGDTITSVITAIILVAFLRETLQPAEDTTQAPQTLFQTFKGYGVVWRDSQFVIFTLLALVMGIVYTQMYSTLSVFLRDYRDFPEVGFGYVMSMNAFMVVTMQYFVTRFTKRYPAILMMALGGLLYAVGFGLYGVVTASVMFFVAMAIITTGEMVVLPTAQALVARLSPEKMRGRYMGFYSYSFMVPNALGPLMAGIIMDSMNPNLVWFLGAGLATLAALGFVMLYLQMRKVVHFIPAGTD
jgi:MFS family permease